MYSKIQCLSCIEVDWTASGEKFIERENLLILHDSAYYEDVK